VIDGAAAASAPDIVAVWDAIDEELGIAARREIRRRGGPGSAPLLVPQLGALAEVLSGVVTRLPEAAFALPGGEADWNVAQALGHDADARAQLALAASLAARGRFPEEAPGVMPGIPGPAEASREWLLRRLATSQRVIERAARFIEGHESEPCPLVHPLVGRLRCGEWLLFAGVHDLMHLEQLTALEARLG
jgi:hypothetical protein